jgi:hypothetical protein
MLEFGYFRVAEWKLIEWEKLYSPLDVQRELSKMREWLDANPRRRKKKYERFVVNWLNKEHAKVQRQQVEARAYARTGAGPRPAERTANREAILWAINESKRTGRPADDLLKDYPS